jgi:hypothetical protein
MGASRARERRYPGQRFFRPDRDDNRTRCAFWVAVSVAIIFGAILGAGESVNDLALCLAFTAWLVVFHSTFRVGWWPSVGMSILATIVFLETNEILGTALGLALPSLFQFPT